MLRRGKETLGLTLKEVKPDTTPTPQTIEKPEPRREVQAFSPSEHVKFLRDTITEMIDDEHTTVFLNQWHPNDMKTLNSVLSMEATSLSQIGHFADLLRWQMHRKNVSPIGHDTHSKDEIRKAFVNFYKELDKRINIRISARQILGIEGEYTKAEILKRNSELHTAQRNKGKGQPQDFVSHLIDTAWRQLSIELDKSKEEEIKGKPELWLDLETEQQYATLIASLEKMTHQAQIEWLGIILETTFTAEEVKKIHLKIVDSADASKIANYKIRRPVIECDDIKTVQMLSKKTGDKHAEKVGGFIMNNPAAS